MGSSPNAPPEELEPFWPFSTEKEFKTTSCTKPFGRAPPKEPKLKPVRSRSSKGAETGAGEKPYQTGPYFVGIYMEAQEEYLIRDKIYPFSLTLATLRLQYLISDCTSHSVITIKQCMHVYVVVMLTRHMEVLLHLIVIF